MRTRRARVSKRSHTAKLSRAVPADGQHLSIRRQYPSRARLPVAPPRFQACARELVDLPQPSMICSTRPPSSVPSAQIVICQSGHHARKYVWANQRLARLAVRLSRRCPWCAQRDRGHRYYSGSTMTSTLKGPRSRAFHRQSGHCCYCGLPMWLDAPTNFAAR